MVDVGRPQTGVRSIHRKQLLAEGVFQLLGERIVSGELEPGARIRDAELAEELDVSRTPVREALQRLERIGLVTMYPSRYTEVSVLTPETIASAHLFAAHQAGFVVRMACPRLTDEERATVSTLIAEIVATVDDDLACSRARGDVITFLAARTENPLQQSLLDDAALAMARALRHYKFGADYRRRMIEGCAALDAALQQNDRDGAEQACRVIYEID